jgi:hypothetical protein
MKSKNRAAAADFSPALAEMVVRRLAPREDCAVGCPCYNDAKRAAVGERVFLWIHNRRSWS